MKNNMTVSILTFFLSTFVLTGLGPPASHASQPAGTRLASTVVLYNNAAQTVVILHSRQFKMLYDNSVVIIPQLQPPTY